MSQRQNHPPVPLSSENVTPSWISEILGVKISSQDFQKETNIQSGSGFLSSMVRVQCTSECGSQKFNLIVKLLPENDTLMGLVISEGFDKTEINFYEKTVPHLVDILPELKEYLCHSYYGHVQTADEGLPNASVLVMEDLKPQGYYTINFAGEESPEQIQEVIEFMAKFHFAGVALEDKANIKLPLMYNFLQGVSNDETSMFYEMAKNGFGEIIELLSTKGTSQLVIDVYRKLAPHAEMIIKKVQAAGKEFACLIHGDLWPNNLLFNNDCNHHTKVIDWQLLGYMDPTYDLAVTIVSSVPKKLLKKEVVEAHLRHYYTVYVAECEKSGSSKLIARDWEEFSKFFWGWGMSYTLLWFLMASDPFAANVPRLVKIYEFLALEINVCEFLLGQV